MAVQYKDYYETLGVSKTASQDDIRKAFRKLARKYHPDVAKDKKAAEAKFKEINETYEVKIPKGVREGQRIRLAGQGSVGTRKELSGDLYLVVRLAQHPDYRVDGDDLVHELELAAWDAVLGTEVNVPTPDGSVRLK